jgi:hypothetical protein
MLDFKWFNGSREEQFVDIFLIEFYAKYDLKLWRFYDLLLTWMFQLEKIISNKIFLFFAWGTSKVASETPSLTVLIVSWIN